MAKKNVVDDFKFSHLKLLKYNIRQDQMDQRRRRRRKKRRKSWLIFFKNFSRTSDPAKKRYGFAARLQSPSLSYWEYLGRHEGESDNKHQLKSFYAVNVAFSFKTPNNECPPFPNNYKVSSTEGMRPSGKQAFDARLFIYFFRIFQWF